jgi:hypothetical protein
MAALLSRSHLSLETLLPLKTFLELNSQADYGCPLRSHFLRKADSGYYAFQAAIISLRDDY